jgi:tetratricopeptide (TPR) repeat protein
VTLAPSSSIVPIATEVGAERRMYLPLAALIALVVVGASVMWDRRGRAWSERAGVSPARVASVGGMLVLAVVSAALSAGTVLRAREYASALSVARTVLERRPSGIAHHMVGTELIAAGYHEEGVMHLREAIRGEPRAYYSLGVELFNQRKLNEAIERLQEFVRREPLLLEVVSARIIMGRAFTMEQKWPEAAEQFRLVLTMTVSNAEAQGLLALALFAQQAFDEAIVHYREYLRHVPNDVAALSNLGIALAASGKPGEAVSTFRRAVEVDPQGGGAHRNLANALLESGDFDEAALHAEQAVALRPDDSVAHDLLGLALASQGKLDQARVHLERSLQIDPAYAEARESLSRLRRMRSDSPRPK